MTVNGVLTPRPFSGWIAVLQRGAQPSSRIALQVTERTPADPGERPELQYGVAFCGDRDFHGALLLGGDARLAPLRFKGSSVPPAGPPSSPTNPLVTTRNLRFVQEGFGIEEALARVQVVRLDMFKSPCLVPFTAGSPHPAVDGPVAIVRGRADAPVSRQWKAPWGLWSGPRTSQAWPYVGAIPGTAQGDLGVFRFVNGLTGDWSTPAEATYNVFAGSLGSGEIVDLARPALTSSTDLAWGSTRPFAATARLTDADAMSTWQSLLIFATIWFGIGGSLVAAVAFDLARSSGHVPVGPIESTPGTAARPGRLGISAWLWGLASVIAVAVVRYARGRYTRRDG